MIPRFFHQRFLYKGGSPQAQQIAAEPVPLPAPPATANNMASLQAEHDFAQQNMQKRSIRKTVIAGDTGGYAKPPAGPATPTGPSF